MSIRFKVICSMALLVLVVCSIYCYQIYRLGKSNQQQLIEGRVLAARQLSATVLEQIERQYRQRIKSFVNYRATATLEQITRAFAERDQEKLFRLSQSFYNILKQENPYFASLGWVLPNNQVFLRVHRPEMKIKDVSNLRPDVAAVNRERVQQAGFTTGRQGPQLRVIEPVFYQGEYLGAVQMGIGAQMVLDVIKEKLGLEAAFSVPEQLYEGDPRVRGGGIKCPGNRIHATDEGLFAELLGEREMRGTSQTLTLKDQRTLMLQRILPLKDYADQPFGCLVVAIDITKILHQTRNNLLSAILLSLVLLVAAAVLLHFGFGVLLERIVGLNHSLEKANRDLEDKVSERTHALLKESEERRVAEDRLRQAEKMEALGLMAGGVAHDLNNILAGIVSYPELLLRRLPEDSSMHRPLEVIKQSGIRAAAVVADMLTVARNAARVSTWTNINALILEYLQSPEAAQLQENFPQVEIVTELDQQLPAICCSSTHVGKCLMNLVLNAAEALDHSGKVVIRTEQRQVDPAVDENPEAVLLVVEDNGPGLAPEHRERIFEPFYSKKKLGRSGTGIGLAVVWNCMEDQGGTVEVVSDLQQGGTRFTLVFPFCADCHCDEPLAQQPVASIQGRGERVLVVDDEAQPRDIAEQILNELGYQVESVASGEEALAKLQTQSYDLVVLDMIMEAGLDGRQTYAEILKIYPGQKALIASGYAASDQIEETLKMGPALLLAKPYTLEQLGRAVATLLRSA